MLDLNCLRQLAPYAWSVEGEAIELSLRLVEELQPTDYHYLQFFNLVLRRVLEGMKLQLVGRSYFNPNAKITMTNHKLELWPGYETSIRQHEDSMLLCCEVSHKVLRLDTVLDLIRDISRRGGGDFRRNVEKALLGVIVMTKYNNRTYKIDDINWDLTPEDKFPYKGEEVRLPFFII